MPRKLRKQEQEKVVVEIPSSDDEEPSNEAASLTMPEEQRQLRRRQEAESVAANTPSVPVNKAFESRSFWKAGDYAAVPTTRVTSDQDSLLEYARIHPQFLHSNATSHKWAFGAIAELLDNAVDEAQNGASYVKVDKIDIMKDGSPALLFQDDGGGMDPDCLRKCMSLGYSTKKGSMTVGQYGNGFKTSTMRLGADVIVFSRANRARATQSVGLLSYTFLRKTGQDDVIVPMIDFDITSHFAEPIIQSSHDDWSFNLNTILEWSPFASKDELMQQFEDVGPHGTKVIIYNLWLNDEGIYELSFDDDDEDIRLRDEANNGNLKKLHKKVLERQSHISYQIRYSLRAYASMLYLRKFENFKIVLRGKPVQQFNIADELRFPKVVTYKPHLAMAFKEAAVETTIGLLKEAPSTVCGFNVYHKNRLIRPFWKVTGDGSSRGNGVVGVLEVNFLEPTHDKQDFERSSVFVRMESKLKQIIIDYWKSHYHLIGHHPPGSSEHNEQKKGLGKPPVEHVDNTQKQLFSDISPSSNVQEEISLDQPIVGLQENVTKDLRTGQPAIQTSICVTDLQGSHNKVASEDRLMSMSVDQICEENINLFMKCEEHLQKENELKQLVEELEKELERVKRKCAELSLHLEARKKQMTSDQVRKVR